MIVYGALFILLEIRAKNKTFKITNDGEYVVGGNKLKVGLPIILEGTDYRFGGVINSIKSIDEQNEIYLELTALQVHRL